MIEKNKVYEVAVSDLTIEGKGVGRIEGMAVFVEGLLPGETGEARITKLAKSYAEAELVRRVSDSPDRVLPPCPYFGECGGCQLQHSSYIGQLNFKNSRVESCMRKIAKIPDDVILNFPLPAREHFGYRNKAALPISQGKDGTIEIGYYKEKSHALINVEKCVLLPQEMNDAITLVRDWANEYKIAAYDEASGKGLLRHLVLRYSHAEEMMVGLVVNGEEIPHAKELIRNLRLNLPEVFSVVQNVNNKRGSSILGRDTKVLFGAERILEEIGGLEFDISLNTFLQVNHVQTELLYQTVFRLARILPGEVVVDLYCGAGTISLCAAKLAGKVYGIEIVPEAVQDAKVNAEKNAIENAEFFCGDCAEGFEKVAECAGKIDVVIVDPPRKGLEKKVIEDIVKNDPGRVVYVSCDPATLARDLALFQEQGYVPRFIQPVDMFPQTAHVETAVLMSKNNVLEEHMGTRIKTFSDGSFLEYDLGSFDAWCVYLTRPGMERKPPRDEEYFGEMLQLAQKYGADMLYEDFLKVYDNTAKEIDDKVLLAITGLAKRQYGEDWLPVDILFTTLYAGMLAEENKKHTKLGKRIKRLGIHSILKEEKNAAEAANLMKGMGWKQIDAMCKARGF